jgi:riboflavin kinase/FMN adenylyltransferase
MVPKGRFELPQAYTRQSLKLVRLPIPPLRHFFTAPLKPIKDCLKAMGTLYIFVYGNCQTILFQSIKGPMELIENIDQINRPFNKAVLTIGNFDGVHKGHQALLHQVMEKADEIGGTSIAITFKPHPLRALGISSPPLITRYDQKEELIEKTGIDVLICIPFDKEFAAITADDFIEKILVNKIGMKGIIIGPDYTFGKDRTGTIDLLKSEGKRLGFETIISPWINDTNTGIERISSTRIREIVMEGKVEQAMKYLGRHYQIRGKVIRGRKRGGSQLGFPTANIKLYDELCPKLGVYAVKVESIKGSFWGVANIGFSPTFGDQMFTIEVHILDFDGDLYDTRLRINLVARLRDEKKFSSIDQLSEQIKKDVEIAKEILLKNGHS